MKKILLLAVAGIITNATFSAVFNVRPDGTGKHTTIKGTLADVTLADGDTLDLLGTFTESDIRVTRSLTFLGHGVDQTIIQGNDIKPTAINIIDPLIIWKANPIIVVGSYASATWARITANVIIKNLTIRNGLSLATNTGFQKAGGIMVMRNSGMLTLTGLNIVDNFGQYSGSATATTGGAAGSAGAIYAQGSQLLIDKCYIANNYARYAGGGICIGTDSNNPAGSNGNVKITNSTFANNECGTTLLSNGGNGGAISVETGVGTAIGYAVDLKVENSTLYGNKCRQYGCGIYAKPLALTSGNGFTDGTLSLKITVNHTTIANNSVIAATKNNIGLYLENNFADLSINNSIVAGNYNTGDATGTSAVSTALYQIGTAGKLSYANITNTIGRNNLKTADNFVHNDTTSTYSSLAFESALSTDAVPVLKIGSTSVAKDFVQIPNSASLFTVDQLGNTRVGNPDAGAFENQTISALNPIEQNAAVQLLTNPVSTTLLLNGNDISQVSIYTTMGQQLLFAKYQNGIDVSKLPTGIYVGKVLSGNNLSNTIRFIKQ
jgi:hypothetical protein